MRIHIIDGTTLWYRGKSVELFKYVGSLNGKGVINIAFDIGKSKKSQVFDEYKKKDLTEVEKERRKEFFKDYQYFISVLDCVYPCFYVPNFEADDVIYNLIYTYRVELKNNSPVIVHTVDYDLLQLLLYSKVSIYLINKQALITKENAQKVLGRPWEEIITEKILLGDKYDNISGLVNSEEEFRRMLDDEKFFIEVLSKEGNISKMLRNIYLVMLGVEEELVEYITHKLKVWKRDLNKFVQFAGRNSMFLSKLLRLNEGGVK